MALSALAITTPHTSLFNIPKPSSSFSPFSCVSSLSHEKDQKFTLNMVSAAAKKSMFNVSVGLLAAASMFSLTPMNADATRIDYYATVGEPLCEIKYVRSGLGFCDLEVGSGQEAPYAELINVHYTARFADGTVFDSSYKRGRPLTMRIGVRKVIRGLDQGILGGEGVPPMQVGGKRKLQIPPHLAYGPEPAGCFSGDCNIPANATLLYDIKFVELYSGNRSKP